MPAPDSPLTTTLRTSRPLVSDTTLHHAQRAIVPLSYLSRPAKDFKFSLKTTILFSLHSESTHRHHSPKNPMSLDSVHQCPRIHLPKFSPPTSNWTWSLPYAMEILFEFLAFSATQLSHLPTTVPDFHLKGLCIFSPQHPRLLLCAAAHLPLSR